VLTNFTYSPGKYVDADTKVTVCATAIDAENDPIQFEWKNVGTAACSGPMVVSNTRTDKGVTECASIDAMSAASYMFSVTTYDMITDENGNLVRIEDWLHAHGYPNDSHASLRFPLFVSSGQVRSSTVSPPSD
jgi:hypothetical protein